MTNVITKKSKINKTGVFAARDFKKGETVLRWKPKNILTKKEYDTLSKSEKHYVASYKKGKYVLQNKPEKYVNHSCDPNTKVVKNCDVAIKNITKGEEITSDYFKDQAVMPFKCHCGNQNCKKII